MAARLLERMAEGERGEELSARELEVLRLLVEGASNKAIAARLSLSENTIKTHISRIFAKLGVQSRAEAVAVALSASWCRCEAAVAQFRPPLGFRPHTRARRLERASIHAAFAPATLTSVDK